MTKTPKRIIRLKEVEAKIGLKRSTIYNLMVIGEFPNQVPLGKRSVGWVEDEVDQWLELRISSRKDPLA